MHKEILGYMGSSNVWKLTYAQKHWNRATRRVKC